ncbi:terpene cyclase/mutase family protein, partial [Verrucomicrobiales bacterium]|nr:terpene cyclase/mutase family protein [Verrucomicrobiales bacterium]
HKPGAGPYGKLLDDAIDYVLSTRKPNGILSVPTSGITVSYNHAIAGLMLGEVYGMTEGSRSALVADTITEALKATWSIQLSPKSRIDAGGWRYTTATNDPAVSPDSDLSVTGWHLMFLRSAKNAEFDVPEGSIEQALKYVRRCFMNDRGKFRFSYMVGKKKPTRAMTATGILSLILGGQEDDQMVKAAADTLLREFRETGRAAANVEYYFYYTIYYCSQAMAQLGQPYWEVYYPKLVTELTANQDSSGAWNYRRSKVSTTYNTAMAVLALSPPYQMLPIYQK